MRDRCLFFPCEVGADARHQRRSNSPPLLDSLALWPKGMARNPPETRLTEGRDLLLLPLITLGTPAAGCSCNIMGPLTSWSTLLASLFQLPFGHTGRHALFPLSGSFVMATELNAGPLARE